MVIEDATGRKWELCVRPSWWLMWTPRLRNLRTKDSEDVGAYDPVGMIIFDVVRFLWKRILWFPVAGVLLAVEICLLALLIPIAVLGSAIGLRRHRVVAVAQDDGARREVVQRGLLATRRARRELAQSLAAPSATT